jgi:erythronate-4-phosphate dehydrogenase
MKILADENMPFAVEAFSTLGEVETCPGREMTPERVRDFDMLAIRSITKVNAGLLEGSSVRFVGTATIGTDHVDADWLESRGIGFASAPGCNAESVAQYITSALFCLRRRKNLALDQMSIGVVGVGNVGSRVVRNAEALGIKVLQNDPPLKRQTGEERFRPLEELMDVDILTLHVPLTKEGPDATWHLADRELIEKLKPGVILMNTARGAVADNKALLNTQEKGRFGALVLDVWEGEPRPHPALAEAVDIGTPHIAGYSYDGKVRGTEMIYRSACEFFGMMPTWDPSFFVEPASVPALTISTEGKQVLDICAEAAESIYRFEEDDARFRKLPGLPPDEQGEYFDRLRKEYPVRREFHNTEVNLEPYHEAAARALEALRFQVAWPQ